MRRAIRSYFRGAKVRLTSERPVRNLAGWTRLCGQRALRVDFLDAAEPDPIELDLVIPTISKDEPILLRVLEGVRRYLRHPVNKIFIVAPVGDAVAEFCRRHDCVLVDERSILGYGPESVPIVVRGRDRSGWLFQQMLKLGADGIVETENYLVVDSDTVMIQPHVLSAGGRFRFFASQEWHEPYFQAFRQLFGYPAPAVVSSVAHMMVFNCGRLREMRSELEQRHSMPWDQAFRKCAIADQISCISEYEAYSNWLRYNHPTEAVNRVCYNRPVRRGQLQSLEALHREYGRRWNSLSFHSHLG